jgi:putative transposase
MGYRKIDNICIVRLINLSSLSPKKLAECEALRREAGRCWSAMVSSHKNQRDLPAPVWLKAADLEKQFKGGQFALHSQTVQALAQKLEANISTITALRSQQKQLAIATGLPVADVVTSRYPYRTPPYQTPIWKTQAISIKQGEIHLSNGKGRLPLVLPLPSEYRQSDICKVELVWRATHYQLALTIDTHATNPPLAFTQPEAANGSAAAAMPIPPKVAGGDLGEIHLLAMTSDSDETSQIITGRALRSVKQLRNKRHSHLNRLLSRCKKGSRRWKKLTRRKCEASAKSYQQQRDILHKASRQAVRFCQAEPVAVLAVGDVRYIADGIDKGRHTNQKISQWTHGLLVRYLKYKLARVGTAVWQIPEDYSTKTCSKCSHLNSQTPKGRNFSCASCGARMHRDLNGAANICSRAKYGSYGKVQYSDKKVMYLQPLIKPTLTQKKGKEEGAIKGSSRGDDTTHVCSNTDVKLT